MVQVFHTIPRTVFRASRMRFRFSEAFGSTRAPEVFARDSTKSTRLEYLHSTRLPIKNAGMVPFLTSVHTVRVETPRSSAA